ncbi:trypsin-like peptidase domain-containing protein [Kitasatospora sp. NPDC001574]
MTGAPLGPAPSATLRDCAVMITVAGGFRGSGFLVAPGLAVTAAHVLRGNGRPGSATGPVAVRHASGEYPVTTEDTRVDPASGDGTPFYPYPDLAVLAVPSLTGHPVAPLADTGAGPGTELTALGFSTHTPTPGAAPDTLVLRVVGPSGAFVRVQGDGVRDGHSGSMLVGPDGLVHGVLKGSRSYKEDQGGWFTPASALAALLGPESDLPAPGNRPVGAEPGDADLVTALMAFPITGRSDGRFDLLDRMGEHLGLPHSFEADERSSRRDHLARIVHRCRHHRDERAALRALYTAMEELAPFDRALEELRLLVGRATGGWESR